MKKLLFVLMVVAGFMVQAQNEKPTKEETIEYIENYFKDEFFTSGSWEELYSPEKSVRNGTVIQITDVSIQGCLLTYSGTTIATFTSPNYYKRSEPKKFANQIDFSKVESIGLTLIIPRGESGYALEFNEKNNPKSKAPNLPFTNAVSSELAKSLQIYKAFQHLRKLCGAPEPTKPIIFD